MAFDYSHLVKRIADVYGTQYNFATAMGLSERSISLKLNNKVSWTSPEIAKASTLLDIDKEDIPKYFFEQKVQTI